MNQLDPLFLGQEGGCYAERGSDKSDIQSLLQMGSRVMNKQLINKQESGEKNYLEQKVK